MKEDNKWNSNNLLAADRIMFEINPEKGNLEFLDVHQIVWILHILQSQLNVFIRSNDRDYDKVIKIAKNVDNLLKEYDNAEIEKDAKKFCSTISKIEKTTDVNITRRLLCNLVGWIEAILKKLRKDEYFQNAILNDYKKIVSSSSFRRLQDKAQVFPLEEHDYARTRLTHTVEVASVARLIVDSISSFIIKKKKADVFNKYKLLAFNYIVECACLIHDIGNPPYGHYGEDITRRYFKDNWFNLQETIYEYNENDVLCEKEKVQICKYITDENCVQDKEIDDKKINQMYNDFVYFDGNAQSLRVMTKIQAFGGNSPINLACSILGAVIKYPYNSIKGSENGKFGYFYSEKDIIDNLKNKCVFIEDIRNPLSLILEAADDICYLTADLDDSIQKGIITESIFIGMLKKIKNNNYENIYKKYCKYNKSTTKLADPFVPAAKKVVQRIKSDLISLASHNFIDNYDSIMNGINSNNDPHELLQMKETSNSVIEEIKKLFANYLYNNENILKPEIKGDAVLTTLYNEFTKSVLSLNFEENKNGETKLTVGRKDYFKEQKIFNLIDEDSRNRFKKEYKKATNRAEKIYAKLRLVVDFISGMTDSYALEIYRTITGIK